MRKLILKWLIGDRVALFDTMFTKDERVAIINALWRRSQDDVDNKTPNGNYNKYIKTTCRELAKELGP